MKRSSSQTYILTKPLHTLPWQRSRLDAAFRAANILYNNMVSDRLRALRQLERTKAWKDNQKAIRDSYSNKECESARKPLFQKKQDMLLKAGMSEYSFHAKIQKYRKRYSNVIGTHVAQKIASAVWAKFEDYFFGSGETIRFRSINDCRSVEGKTNGTNLFFSKGQLRIGKKLKIPFDLEKELVNRYEHDALFTEDGKLRRIKYCRIKREPRNDGWQYFVQFVVEGTPPVKKTAEGVPMYPMGTGSVGLDIGPQTLAVVSYSDVKLYLLARGLQDIANRLRRINRAMDRSRRATNPGFFDSDGTVIPKNKLPGEILDEKGRRKWVQSKAYRELVWRRFALLNAQARLREQKHHELANRIVVQGNRFVVEDMNFAALAKKAKEAKKSEKTGRFHSRKRFGKSIANRAPAKFVDILKKKVIQAGGMLYEVSTFKTKASQYNHVTDEFHKKKLSARWDVMPEGTKVQRDLYSAFLLQHVDNTLENYDKEKLHNDFPAFFALHSLEIEILKQTDMPSSCGVKKL